MSLSDFIHLELLVPNSLLPKCANQENSKLGILIKSRNFLQKQSKRVSSKHLKPFDIIKVLMFYTKRWRTVKRNGSQKLKRFELKNPPSLNHYHLKYFVTIKQKAF